MTELNNDFELIKLVLIEKIHQLQVKDDDDDDEICEFIPNDNISSIKIGQIKSLSTTTTCSSLITSSSSSSLLLFKDLEAAAAVAAANEINRNDVFIEKTEDIGELLLECSVLMNEKKYDDAIKYCNKIIELDKNNAIAYNIKCLCNFDNEIDESIHLINKSIELDPKNSDYLITKAHLLAYQKKYSKAIECYNKAILLNSNANQAYIGIGKCKYKI